MKYLLPFLFMGLLALPFVFVISMFISIISTIAKTSNLRKLISQVESDPCQGTAEELYKQLKKLNRFNKVIFRVGGQNIIDKETWAGLYNNYIAPSALILPETKKDIHKALVNIGVFNLKSGISSPLTKEERGDLGEDNVWHTLEAIANRGNCKIFRNVIVGSSKHKSEIDAIIVSHKGVFLLEVKTVSHKPVDPYDSSNVVVFEDLLINPYTQIFEHQTSFMAQFGLDESIIKNLLVMSYPYDEKKKIDISTFPTDTIYTAVKVDDLLQYYMEYNSDVVLDDVTIARISQGLTSQRNANYSNFEKQPKFCPNCGNKLATNMQFCPNCGKPISKI